MKFTILTLFPDMVRTVLGTSMLGRAANAGTVRFEVRDLRDWGTGAHKSVDDTPYGGGAGMVLKVDVVDRALEELKREARSEKQEVSDLEPRVILMTPQGRTFRQAEAERFASVGRDLILVAGHYEGFDERIRAVVDDELSIGDFVLTGGELPALTVVDAITRLLPGSLGSDESVKEESFSLRAAQAALASKASEAYVAEAAQEARLLEYPHYTRPERYAPRSADVGELAVPEMLKSGNHAAIAAWRKEQSLERTKLRRPDLLSSK